MYTPLSGQAAIVEMARTFADTLARVESGPRMLTYGDGHGSSPGIRPAGRASNQGVLDKFGLEDEMQRLSAEIPIRTVQHVYTNGTHGARTILRLFYPDETADPVDEHQRILHASTQVVTDRTVRRCLSHAFISDEMYRALRTQRDVVHFVSCTVPDLKNMTTEREERLMRAISLQSMPISDQAHDWDSWASWLTGIQNEQLEPFILGGLTGKLRLIEQPKPRDSTKSSAMCTLPPTPAQQGLVQALESIRGLGRTSALQIFAGLFKARKEGRNGAAAEFFVGYINDIEALEQQLRPLLLRTMDARTRERVDSWMQAASKQSGTLHPGSDTHRTPSVW